MSASGLPVGTSVICKYFADKKAILEVRSGPLAGAKYQDFGIVGLEKPVIRASGRPAYSVYGDTIAGDDMSILLGDPARYNVSSDVIELLSPDTGQVIRALTRDKPFPGAFHPISQITVSDGKAHDKEHTVIWP